MRILKVRLSEISLPFKRKKRSAIFLSTTEVFFLKLRIKADENWLLATEKNVKY